MKFKISLIILSLTMCIINASTHYVRLWSHEIKVIKSNKKYRNKRKRRQYRRRQLSY